MKVVVTGNRGFIGKNLLERLKRMEDVEISTFDKNDDIENLEEMLKQSDFVFHLAGVNRPKDTDEFYRGNRDLTRHICGILEKHGKNTPILISSSIQATLDNDYGKSKKEAEDEIIRYANDTGATVYIYRLPNVFGKWSRPNYNSVVATWCHNISRNIPIVVDDESKELNLVYIDDVVDHFMRHLNENGREGIIYPDISPVYKKSLGEIVQLLENFERSRETLILPHVGAGFERALYATYLSFLPIERFSYPLKGHRDERGTFYEVLKTLDSGQFSFSTTACGVTRGNHYHHTKNEKFIVVKGKARVKQRQIHSEEVIEFVVSDDAPEVIETIPGYVHNITNIGKEDLILLVWANEIFDPEHPDTYPLEV